MAGPWFFFSVIPLVASIGAFVCQVNYSVKEKLVFQEGISLYYIDVQNY